MKKVIITGIFGIATALIAGFFSYIAGGTNAIQKVNNEVSQVVNIDSGDYVEITKDLIKKNQILEDKYENLSKQNEELKSNYDELIKLNREGSYEAKKLNNIVYLFDNKPYLTEGIYLYMLNNNPDTMYSQNGFYYPSNYRMESTGKAYNKGMSITPNSNMLGELYYNIDRKYAYLSGKIAFEDLYAERVDKKYSISFYVDNELVDTFEIIKGESPISFDIEINRCEILKITLERPPGDMSEDPNINLIEFILY